MIESGQLSELDELRRKVADLSHELAEQERVSREQQRRLDHGMRDLRERTDRFTPLSKG